MTQIKTNRANRITVQAQDNSLMATFYRTHVKMVTVASTDTHWMPKADTNKVAQREDFRQYVIDHAGDYGVEWNPTDMRAEGNMRIAKYTDTDTLIADAIALIGGDITELVKGTGFGIDGIILSPDDATVTPKTYTAKGTDLSTMGIEDGRYLKSGNWAWADIEVSVTLTKDDKTIYYLTNVELVSGQLKKPHITKTAIAEDIKASLAEVGIITDTPKAEDTKAKDTKGKAKGKGKKSDK